MKNTKHGIALYFIALALIFTMQDSYATDALVTKIHDGDSLYVQGITPEIRLRYADTPELKAFTWGTQPYAIEARSALVALCGGRTATVTKPVFDRRTRRIIANLSCQGQDAASYLIKNGHAWAYRYTANKTQRLWQANAKAQGLGLWALSNPIEPLIWRKNGMHAS